MGIPFEYRPKPKRGRRLEHRLRPRLGSTELHAQLSRCRLRLFGRFARKTNPDHMRINDTRDSAYGYNDTPAITRWPWGFAHGAYQGCTFAYGTSKFELVNGVSSLCPGSPAPPSERCDTSAFCTDQQSDPFCSPRGVWGSKDGEPNGKNAYALGCEVFANIGHAGVFSNAPSPAHSLGFVPAGALLDIRYVTKDRQFAWGKWTGHRFVNDICLGVLPALVHIPDVARTADANTDWLWFL